MAFRYKAVQVKDVVETPLVISKLAQRIAPEHQRFFPGWTNGHAEDRRQRATYRHGPTIHEPGIVERWSNYEELYQSTPRLRRFWATVMPNAIVEPTSLTVLGPDFVIRETVRSTATFKKVFGDVSEDDAGRVLKGGEYLETAADLTPRSSVKEAFLLGFGVFENYFNWTLRFASRLRCFEAMPPAAKLLVPRFAKAYIKKTLDFAGIAEDRIVQVSAPVHVERLHLFSPIALGRYELLPQMRVTMQENPLVANLPDTGEKWLYIPRFDVKFRHVTNEDKVIDAMSAMGCRIFDNSKYSVREQVQAFRSADIIIAPHGAGLSNIAYAKPGTTIVEIIPQGYAHGVTSYRSLADMFGHRYIQLFAREVVPYHDGNRANSDIEVDIEELKQTIGSEIAGRA